ncbi:hypothetical protein KFL_001850240 [Klebsormidium nitens]|uniref:AB hydrolase-1 domain-containing protein n=1 Tax=Klebsormidium nitens TaxID=105231 RepID=A0A1Y1I089_KLENI|nr:hypothetical protein KFL_001850240 [Klebsormidium nitens]|eukprot:GAQ84350.1 hypothetical protein KFL_001850240 [Klebsormidium nitens]
MASKPDAKKHSRSFQDIVFGFGPEPGTPLGPIPQKAEAPSDGQEEVVEECTVTHRYVDNDGAKIHFVECGKRGAHLVLLIHGFPEFWYSWLYQFKPLSDAGYHVVAVDCRGYGWSAKPAAVREYSMSKVTSDLLRVVDTVAPGRRCTIVGHDWGGRVLWGFLTLHAQRVLQAVVLNAPHPVTMAKALMSNPRQLQKSWYIGFFQMARLAEHHLSKQRFAAIRSMFKGVRKYPEEVVQRHVDAMAIPGALTGALNYYRAAFGQGLWPAPPVVRVPVKVIWGEQDFSMEKDIATPPAELVPNAQVTFVKKASHWVMWDDPETVSSEMVAFIKEGLRKVAEKEDQAPSFSKL